MLSVSLCLNICTVVFFLSVLFLRHRSFPFQEVPALYTPFQCKIHNQDPHSNNSEDSHGEIAENLEGNPSIDMTGSK